MTIQKLDLTQQNNPQLHRELHRELHTTSFGRMYKAEYIDSPEIGTVTRFIRKFLLYFFDWHAIPISTEQARKREAGLASIEKYEAALNGVVEQLAQTPVLSPTEANLLGIEPDASEPANIKERNILNKKIKDFYVALEERVTLITPDALDRRAALYQIGLMELTRKIQQHNKKWFTSHIDERRAAYIQNDIIAKNVAVERIVAHMTPESIVQKGRAALQEELDLYTRIFGNEHLSQDQLVSTIHDVAHQPRYTSQRFAFDAALRDQFLPGRVAAHQEEEINRLTTQVEDAFALLHVCKDRIAIESRELEKNQHLLEVNSHTVSGALDILVDRARQTLDLDREKDTFASDRIYEMPPKDQLREIDNFRRRHPHADAHTSESIDRAEQLLTSYLQSMQSVEAASLESYLKLDKIASAIDALVKIAKDEHAQAIQHNMFASGEIYRATSEEQLDWLAHFQSTSQDVLRTVEQAKTALRSRLELQEKIDHSKEVIQSDSQQERVLSERISQLKQQGQNAEAHPAQGPDRDVVDTLNHFATANTLKSIPAYQRLLGQESVLMSQEPPVVSEELVHEVRSESASHHRPRIKMKQEKEWTLLRNPNGRAAFSFLTEPSSPSTPSPSPSSPEHNAPFQFPEMRSPLTPPSDVSYRKTGPADALISSIPNIPIEKPPAHDRPALLVSPLTPLTPPTFSSPLSPTTSPTFSSSTATEDGSFFRDPSSALLSPTYRLGRSFLYPQSPTKELMSPFSQAQSPILEGSLSPTFSEE